MSSALRRDVRDIVRALEADHGCTAVISKGSSHWKVTMPGKPPVFMSHSPSDHRAIRNIKRDIRNVLGIDL